MASTAEQQEPFRAGSTFEISSAISSSSLPRASVPGTNSVHNGKTSTNGAMFSLVTTAVGVGVLCLPAAMAKGGWLGGCGCLAISAVFACQCGKMLVEATEKAEEVAGRSFARMEDIMEACTGSSIACIVVKWSLNFTLVAIGAVMLILLGKHMNYVMPNITMQGWLVLCAAIFLPLGWLRDMKYISDLAFIGVFASFATGALIVLSAFSHMAVEGPSWSEPLEPIVKSAPPRSSSVGPSSLGGLSSAYCLFVFSFTYALVCPSLRTDMEKPQEMSKAIDRACGIMTLIYGAVAMSSYLAWGSLVQEGGGNILFSMMWCSADELGHVPASIKYMGSWACYTEPTCSSAANQQNATVAWMCGGSQMCAWNKGKCGSRFYPHKSAIGVCVAMLVVVNVLITYLLVLSPVFKAFDTEDSSVTWKPSAPRTAIIVTTMALALMVPYFSEVIGVISAATLVGLQMFCPVIMIRGISTVSKQEISLRDSIWHTIIIVCGVLAMFLGLSAGIADLVSAVSKDPDNLTAFLHIFESSFWTASN